MSGVRGGLRGAGAAAAIGAWALAAAALAADGSPVAARQAAMKQMGFALRDARPYADGQKPYDAAKVKALLQVVVSNGEKLQALFPPGSGEDPKSSADPKIWQDKKGFEHRLAELSAKAAHAQGADGPEGLKAQYMAIGHDCQACHDVYRRKKS